MLDEIGVDYNSIVFGGTNDAIASDNEYDNDDATKNGDNDTTRRNNQAMPCHAITNPVQQTDRVTDKAKLQLLVIYIHIHIHIHMYTHVLLTFPTSRSRPPRNVRCRVLPRFDDPRGRGFRVPLPRIRH